MTPKELAEKALADLLNAREALRRAVEQHDAGSTGQLEELQWARAHMDAARNKLVVLEWNRAEKRRVA